MIYVDGLKYACEACIKGHRSSTCSHTDRALFEIKKKGRPVTQCEHCRQLRKTKQVHVKCSCGASSEGGPKETRAKRKILTSAAFPDGLSMPSPTPQKPPKASGGCGCKSTGRCSCATPIKKSLSSSSSAASSAPVTPPPLSSCCSGKPKPTYNPPPLVNPDVGITAQATSLFNDLTHTNPGTYAYTTLDMHYAPPVSTPTPTPTAFSWPSGAGVETCHCGVTCACPGCIDHADPSTAMLSTESCPYACTACSSCNGFGFAPPPPTHAHAHDAAGALTDNPLDMWVHAPDSDPAPAFPGLVSTLASNCCGGACQCTTQYLLCQCTPDCCGCCFGCSCSDSEEGAAGESGSGRASTCGSVGGGDQEEEERGRGRLGFAVSGERGSCCSELGRGVGKEAGGDAPRRKRRRVENRARGRGAGANAARTEAHQPRHPLASSQSIASVGDQAQEGSPTLFGGGAASGV